MSEDASFVAVVDLETQGTISGAPGTRRDEKIASLQMSCGSVLSIPSDFVIDPRMAERAVEMSTMQTFWRDGNTHNNVDAMIRVLDKAELIVGFNLVGFDWLVMKKYYSDKTQYGRHREKTHDIFSRVRDATGIWFKLDRLLQLNRLDGKTADGLEAIRMWEEGRRDELQHYCECDVRQCTRLGLSKSIDVGLGAHLENYSFGIASAIASKRVSNKLKCESL